MNTWKIAAVQADCRLGDVQGNRAMVERKLREAAALGARLVIFPECVITGYSYESREEALPFAETIPGPTTEALITACRHLGIWTVCGMLERDGERLFNVAVLIGPTGLVANYRKIHLPFLGVDRFTTPGDQPFAVHDIAGLRVGLSICYDGGFPETTRILMLKGADLVVLPTNWPVGAESTVCHLVQCRALENHVYYAAVNRVGSERSTRFIGQSKLVNVNGELLAMGHSENEEILTAEIDPLRARNKKIVRIPGKYELHRRDDRRPDMYGPLLED
jgi:predicted amidohydrolase